MSFPDIYRSLSTEELLRAFRAGPARVREVLSGLSGSELRERVAPGRWSIQEIAFHLADAEIMGAARFRLALAEPGAAVPVYDQDAWAEALDYSEAGSGDLDRALQLFGNLRRATERILPAPDHDAWQGRSVEHSEWGTVTLRQLLELYADHSERHIGGILEVRAALGHVLEYPLLLEERLY